MEKSVALEGSTPTTPHSEYRKILPELLLITIVAAILRFLFLDRPDLWMDEVRVYFDAIRGTNEVVSDAHRVHLGILGWLLNNISDSPWMLRFWGALAGTLAVPIMALTAYLLGGRPLFRVCGFLAAFSPFLVFYSRDANYYGPMTFFASLQLLCIALFVCKQRVLSVILLCLTAVITHYNHPFASIHSVVSISIVGLLTLVDLWNHRAHLMKYLSTKGVVFLVIGFLLFAGLLVFVGKGYSQTFGVLQDKFSFGKPLANVSLTPTFFYQLFTSLLVVHVPVQGYETVSRFLGLIPFVLAIFGVFQVVRSFLQRLQGASDSSNHQNGIAQIAVVGVILLSLILALFVIFNVSYRTFYPRYFSFLVPGGMLCVALGICSLSSFAGKSFRSEYLLAPILLFYAFQLTPHYSPKAANFKLLDEYVENESTEDSRVFFPVNEELSQALFYFNSEQLEAFILHHLRPSLKHSARNWLSLYLYGRKDVIVASAWRHAPLGEFWTHLDAITETVVAGTSVHGPEQNARVYHWKTADRALLPNIATRFEYGPGTNTVVVDEGHWKLHGDSKLIDQLKSRFSSSTPDSVQNSASVLYSFDAQSSGTLLALPVIPEKLDLGPFGHYNLTNDTRNKEGILVDGKVIVPGDFEEEPEGEPVFQMAFDGVFNYVIYQPANEQRHLVFKRFCSAEPLPKGHGKNTFLYEVAVNGVHQGIYPSEDKPGEWVETQIDLVLPPGNQNVMVYATKIRLNDPFHDWIWGGTEWNQGPATKPTLPVPDSLLTKIPDSSPFIWGEPGAVNLSPQFVPTAPHYNRHVSSERTGPSGSKALLFTFNGNYSHAKEVYSQTFTKPIPVREGQLFVYSTFIRNEYAKDYAASLMNLFLDANGKSMGATQGKQQHSTYPQAQRWVRYVEIVQIPKGCAYFAPGVFVYPPDPAKTKQQGRFMLDAITPATGQEGPFTPGYLTPALFFDPEQALSELNS
ncbi:MAG: hypothetical protein SFY68_12560 [Candidatus Sumerlaeia bacterium]|nr:hypothetical protein [Candidatus Sumerlaeia bacterium]